MSTRSLCRFTMALLLLLPQAAAAGEMFLPPATFRPATSASEYSIDQGGLGCLRTTKGTAFFVAVVPVENGGVIEEISAVVEDTAANSLALVSLMLRRETSSEAVAVSHPSRGGAELEELVAVVAKPVPARDGDVYILQVLLTGQDVCLQGVRVKLR